ncbi:MAG: hypothetical protein BWX66_01588 [Deltaproteobacteria bacterium ADurb.Bin058]|nr:MAG: hypothetical protein BWX66_01588 [Deltaproteobacteria bacterium ADurb.Bin058]
MNCASIILEHRLAIRMVGWQLIRQLSGCSLYCRVKGATPLCRQSVCLVDQIVWISDIQVINHGLNTDDFAIFIFLKDVMAINHFANAIIRKAIFLVPNQPLFPKVTEAIHFKIVVM